MKKVVYLLISLLFCSQLLAQNKEVVYGSVRTDGYQKITKGAFWKTRPEAQRVYNNEYPDGVEIKILESDYFVRFIDSEHNNFDGNYIVFPKGEKLYKKNGVWYAAICGNKIDFFQSVNNTIIQTEESNLSNLKPEEVLDPVSPPFVFPKDLGTASRKFVKEKEDNSVEIPKLQQKRRRPGLVIAGVVVGTGGLVTAAYFIFKKPNIPNTPPPDDWNPSDPTGPP